MLSNKKLLSITLAIFATLYLQTNGLSSQKKIENEISDLKLELSNLKSTLKDYFTYLNNEETATFNAKHLDEYQIIRTRCGIFWITIKKVKKYLEGYKIIFTIGNPYNARYENYKIKIKWKNDFKEEIESEFTFSKPLLAGSWTDIECFITPATLDNLENLSLKIGISYIYLFADKFQLN